MLIDDEFTELPSELLASSIVRVRAPGRNVIICRCNRRWHAAPRATLRPPTRPEVTLVVTDDRAVGIPWRGARARTGSSACAGSTGAGFVGANAEISKASIAWVDAAEPINPG